MSTLQRSNGESLAETWLPPARKCGNAVMGAVALWVLAMVCLGVVVSLSALESTSLAQRR